jgi:protein-disulfide isomerase
MLRAPERWIIAVVFVAAFVLAVMAALEFSSPGKEWKEETIVNADAAFVLGPYGNSLGSRYTLVEFGDYECPPCRATQQSLPGLLRPYQGQVTLDFRNFPLTTIHPYAESAAIVAESARLEGRLWEVHDFLYATPMSWNTLMYARAHFGLLRSKYAHASEVVHSDTVCAGKLGVSGTPTFFLVDSHRRVVRLGSVNDLSRVIERG